MPSYDQQSQFPMYNEDGISLGRKLLSSSQALDDAARQIAHRLGFEGFFDARWNPRMRSNAGRVLWPRDDTRHPRVELNKRLFRRHPDRIWETLAHEVCHVVAGRGAGHGSAWQELMTDLGLEPTRCHDFDVSDLKVHRRKWLWECLECENEFVRRHRAARKYRCECGGRLRVDRQIRERG